MASNRQRPDLLDSQEQRYADLQQELETCKQRLAGVQTALADAEENAIQV